MARTRATKRPRLPSIPDRSILLQLMGFPGRADANAKTVHADWARVIERLASNPEEAKTNNPRDPDALLWALQNESTPLTLKVLRAFIDAFPDVVTRPRSNVIYHVLQNPVLAKQQQIIDTLLQTNPKHLSGSERSRTFQLMGFPSSRHKEKARFLYGTTTGCSHVDWNALETHLQLHPKEACILCPNHGSMIFPLEAAVQYQFPPVPLSTVQLLLRLCPEAVTIPDSSALLAACACRNPSDPQVVGAILEANPAMAAVANCTTLKNNCADGLPLHSIVFSPYAAQLVPDLVAAYPMGLADTSDMYGRIPLQVAAQELHVLPTDLLRAFLESEHQHTAYVDGEMGQLFSVGDPNVGDFESPMTTIIGRATLIQEEENNNFGVEIAPGYQAEIDRVWLNLCLALQAAGTRRTQLRTGRASPTPWDYPLLHGVIEFGERQLFFDRILRERMTDPVNQFDFLGRTPLAVALEMAESLVQNYNDDEDNMQLPLVLEKLLDDQQGGSLIMASVPIPILTGGGTTFPLHQALCQQHVLPHESIDTIATAFPEALLMPDPTTNLPPCLLAAVGKDARVETIFSLMTRAPNLIAELCQTC